MGKKNKKQNKNQVEEPEVEVAQEEAVEQEAEAQVEAEEQEVEETVEPTLEEQIELLKGEIEKEKKEYLFLIADFDNYRKRTLQEKQDLIKKPLMQKLDVSIPI